MIRWSCVGVDVQTGELLEALPVSQVRFSQVLNGYGSFSATLDLRATQSTIDISAYERCYQLSDAVDVGRRAIYVLANGRPVWGGLSWTAPDQDGDVISLSAAEWGSYFAKRVIRSTVTYTSQDQLAIARSLITTAQAVTGGNALVATGTETSGVLRTVTYTAGGLPVVEEQINNLATLSSGFDYAWPVEWNGDTLRGRLLLGYPHLGTSTVGYVCHGPRGRMRGSTLTSDATNMATTSWAIGAQVSGGSFAPTASSTDASLLSAGYLVLDKVTSYSDVSDTSQLQAHADADQVANGGVTVSATADVPIGDVVGYLSDGVLIPPQVSLGDTVRFERQGRRDGASGYVDTLRVTEIDFDPTAQIATLILSPRITTGGRVPTRRDMEARIAHLERLVRLLAVGS